jgi:hypothetical protein
MLSMFFSHILYTKIIHDQCELDGASDMSPEALCEFGLTVAMDGQMTRKELVGKDNGLGKALHAFLNFNIHMAI